MLREKMKYFNRQQKSFMMVKGISQYIVIGVIDYFTGNKVSSPIFSLQPVFLLSGLREDAL